MVAELLVLITNLSSWRAWPVCYESVIKLYQAVVR